MNQDNRPRDELGRYTFVGANEALKAKQLNEAERARQRMNNPFNPEDYNTGDEDLYNMAVQADYVHNHENVELHTIEEGRNKGFIAYKNDKTRVYIENMGSTGGNLGRKLLSHAADSAAANNKDLAWSAVTERAQAYYDHIGLGKYGNSGKHVRAYVVKNKDLAELKKLLK